VRHISLYFSLLVFIMAVMIIRNKSSEVPHGCSRVTSNGAYMNRKTHQDISLLTALWVRSIKTCNFITDYNKLCIRQCAPQLCCLIFYPKKKLKMENHSRVPSSPLYSQNTVLTYNITSRDEGRWEGHSRRQNDCKMQISEAEMKRSLMFIGL